MEKLIKNYPRLEKYPKVKFQPHWEIALFITIGN